VGVEIVPGVFDFVVITAVVLLWAKWAKLDLGLRVPALSGAWPWILLYIVWCGAEWVAARAHPIEADSQWVERVAQRSLLESILLFAMIAPLWEELLFRGAMFSALMRRWGIWAAAIVPSLLWALLHLQYEWWLVASLAGSGMVLAILRWKSGSLYLPLILHASGNLMAALGIHHLSNPTG